MDFEQQGLFEAMLMSEFRAPGVLSVSEFRAHK